tara:strand:- start:401 stop:616 length:216 start_codon:yes stop_codon:yes gene_type:complete
VQLRYEAVTPTGTSLTVNLLDSQQRPLLKEISNSSRLEINQPVQLEFVFRSMDPKRTPLLDYYQLRFDRIR